MAKQFKPETLCVQAGWTPKKGEPRVLPYTKNTASTCKHRALMCAMLPAP